MDVCLSKGWYYGVSESRRCKTMATTTYLDSLSPGMKARLDPTTRLTKQQKPVHVFYLHKDDAEMLQSKNGLTTITRRGKPGELKIRSVVY
jgi:hypothetical protein